ncbi:MAG: TetR/AcrR family transcriptional regulator [Microthrixaceae bacterium]
MLSEDRARIQRGDASERQGNDGRRARRERGRAAVLEAARAYFDEGDVRPTAEALAERAGVSPASLYRYFDRLDDLPRLVFESQVQEAAPLLRVEVEGRPLDERIRGFVRGRVAVYERVQGTARMGRSRAVDHADIAASLAVARRRWSRQARTVFAVELDPQPAASARDLAAMVDTIASFESWDLLSTVHGLPRRSIETQWRAALQRLLVP